MEGIAMKLLILGADGMLGHKLFQILGAAYSDCYGTISGKITDAPWSQCPFLNPDNVYSNVDAMNFQGLEQLIRTVDPDYVINCFRVATHGTQIAPPIKNITVNSLLPHRLAEICATFGIRLIHFSSDCVFSGKKGFYAEEDTPDATHAYGQSRLLGDVYADNTLVLRGSVVGRELIGNSSLLEWFLLQKGKEINGFTKAIYSGISSIETARMVRMILGETPGLTGLFNVASEPISKYDLLNLAKESFQVDVTLHKEEGFSVDRSLNGEKFKAATDYVPPTWSTMMIELAKENKQYNDWRKII